MVVEDGEVAASANQHGVDVVGDRAELREPREQIEGFDLGNGDVQAVRESDAFFLSNRIVGYTRLKKPEFHESPSPGSLTRRVQGGCEGARNRKAITLYDAQFLTYYIDDAHSNCELLSTGHPRFKDVIDTYP